MEVLRNNETLYTSHVQRICRQCQSAFEITESDQVFLAHISPTFNGKKELIPPPTHCPQCRVQRRMAWRNDRTFYRRKCDLTGEEFISMYPSDTAFPVYKQDAWHSDHWDALTYGRPSDPSRPFFEQWMRLHDQVPHWGVAISNCQNSDYCNYCNDEKNCYLDIAAEANEDCFYNHFTKYSCNCVDCMFCYHSTLCYECIQCYNCYSCKHSQYLDDCSDCTLCFDCKGCKNCLFSINLRNKEYYILNEPHTKEEYQKKLKELRMGSFSALREAAQIWKTMRLEKGIYRDMYTLNSQACTGNDIKGSKNCGSCFNVVNCEDGKFLYDVLDAKNCYDMNYSPYGPEACYEVTSTIGLKFSAFYFAGPYNSHCLYSHMLQSCQNCFGCIGLKRKQYCVLNRQYSKEKYEELVPKIIEHMRTSGEYGEFFPASLSPHGYNETVAGEYLPLTKQEVLKRGWRWRDQVDETPKVAKIIPAPQLPDSIDDIPDDILHWAIQCEATERPYRIVTQELNFYRKMQIPVPRFHPDERHRRRVALRNPRRLWDRTCAKCGKSIRTSYQPSRPEAVYCEPCYLAAVY